MKRAWILFAAVFVSFPVYAVMPLSKMEGAAIMDNLHQIPPVDSGAASHDNACADYAAVIVSGVDDPKSALWKRDCAENPNVGICKETIKMIVQVKGTNSGLQCTGRAAMANDVEKDLVASR